MTDEPQIPLLQDLLFRGQPTQEKEKIIQTLDENTDFEIEQDEVATSNQDPAENLSVESENEYAEVEEKDPSVQELIIDEEIRMILDKYMDKAYAEIIRLLNNKIS